MKAARAIFAATAATASRDIGAARAADTARWRANSRTDLIAPHVVGSGERFEGGAGIGGAFEQRIASRAADAPWLRPHVAGPPAVCRSIVPLDEGRLQAEVKRRIFHRAVSALGQAVQPQFVAHWRALDAKNPAESGERHLEVRPRLGDSAEWRALRPRHAGVEREIGERV